MKKLLKRMWIPSFLRRLYVAFGYYPAWRIIKWAFKSKEYTNFTYEITDNNRKQLAHLLANTFEVPLKEIYAYMDECKIPNIGRKIGWYVIARILKPQIIVESGVYKGFGAVILCEALLKNGYGFYYGIDIVSGSGELLTEKYQAISGIITGDSVETLKVLNKARIDLFIHDSTASDRNREINEYNLLPEEAVILSNSSHTDDTLLRFSEQHGRKFVFFREQPLHWYPGGGIGISI